VVELEDCGTRFVLRRLVFGQGFELVIKVSGRSLLKQLTCYQLSKIAFVSYALLEIRIERVVIAIEMQKT